MKPNAVFKQILIGLIFLSGNILNAQQTDENEKCLHTFNVYFINGYGLSYDVYKKDNATLRLYLDFNGYGNDKESIGNQKYYSDSSEEENKTDNNDENSSFTLLFSPQYSLKFYRSELGAIYFSTGPYFQYNKTTNKYVWEREVTNEFYDKEFFSNSESNNIKSYSLGVTFILGINGNLSEHISLFAETHFSISKFWEDEETTYDAIQPNYTYTRKSTYDNDGWSYKTIFIKGGISISL